MSEVSAWPSHPLQQMTASEIRMELQETSRVDEPFTRNMQQELQEWRKQRAAERAAKEFANSTPTRARSMRTDENTPTRIAALMRGKVMDDTQKMWSPGSSPKTPSSLRGHVSATSPLMEVCQNTVRSAGEPRRCRPTVSQSASPEFPFALPSPLAVASSTTSLKWGEVTGKATKEFVREDTDFCILDSSEGHQEANPAVLELSTWEDAMQVPAVPPASPVSPRGLPERRERDHWFAMQGFLHGLPQSLHAATEAAPPCQSLLSRLDVSEVEVQAPWPAFEASCRSPPQSSLPSPLLRHSPNGSPPVPLSLEASLLDATRLEEDEQPLSEADELLARLRNYPRAWPEPSWPFEQTTEDQLCRAHDIDMFWFFEVRDLARIKAANERKFQERLQPIAEYPPNWPQWQIESDRTRSAMRVRKRTPRRLRPDEEAKLNESGVISSR